MERPCRGSGLSGRGSDGGPYGSVLHPFFFIATGVGPAVSKIISIGLVLVFNYAGRRFVVFPEKTNPDWKPQIGE